MSENLEQNKQNLGQFYTTNYKHILQNLFIPENIKTIVEPFAGKGDLVDFINEFQESKQRKNLIIESYDIDPKQDYIIKQDTLLNPPDYSNKFVITNPPYLARNKSKDKTVFDKYKQNDLYKCFIQTLINSNCLGGILIIPLNFWCSIRKSDIVLRKQFLDKYGVITLNIFEESVFDDTSYAVCSFQFEKKNNENLGNDTNDIKCVIFPSKKEINLSFNKDNNYTIGGEIYKLPQNDTYTIERATEHNKFSKFITKLLVQCKS